MRARRKAALWASYLTIASPRHPRDATENEDIIARAEVSRDPGFMPHILATSGGRLDRTVFLFREGERAAQPSCTPRHVRHSPASTE